MSILITGATGYLGSQLVQLLAGQGHDVRVLCRTRPSLPLFSQKSVHIAIGDIEDPSSLDRAMTGISQVYHLAAYARIWSKDKERYHNLNVTGTRNVLEAAGAAGVRKVLHVSTAGVVGPSKEKPMDEMMPRNADFFNRYESTKWASEQVCHAFSRNGLPVTIVNPSRVYGPGLDTGSNPVTKLIELYMKGRWKIIPGSGEDIGSYCYVDDVVQGLVAGMEKGRDGERYLLGGVNASFNELLRVVSRISGIYNRSWHVPFFLLEAFSYAQLFVANTTGKPPMITPDWVRKYQYHWALDSSKAQQELGYTIRPLEEGIAATVSWLRENRLDAA
jgi:farnesol dehydrogenase